MLYARALGLALESPKYFGDFEGWVKFGRKAESMTEWIELFQIVREKKGVRSVTTIAINKDHEGDWIEHLKDWIKRWSQY